MKIAPLYHALKRENWADPIIVHTGQHYDFNMSDAFLKDLGLPEPDIHLGIGSGTHAEQTGQVMIAYEKTLIKTQPDMVIVVGDVNSTMACTIAASKIQYPPSFTSDSRNNPSSHFELTAMSHRHRPFIAHLEAGLRSFDRTMPEEINRLVTDTLADILWTPSIDGDENLMREGISPDKIHRVGNIMIDSLEMLRHKIEEQAIYEDLGLEQRQFGLVTLHRPSNVDNPEILAKLCNVLTRIAKRIPFVFPIHPRTRKNIEQAGLLPSLVNTNRLIILKPIGYIQFMNLVFNCQFALTDSGGIQEETTYLGIPCLTLRPNTERPITIRKGTNRLCNLEDLEKKVDKILSGKVAQGKVPEFWDGQTASRVLESIKKIALMG
jgi:UDP-N-acetylglucosamine 2-epimerase (non-hydrolysing)